MTDYKEKFEKMRIAGKLAARTLDMLTENIKEGVSTDYIDKLGYEFIRDNGGHSAPLYYRGFTKSLDTDPLIFGVANGLIKLDTNPTLINHYHEYPVSKYTDLPYKKFDPYNPTEWEKIVLDGIRNVIVEPDTV